MNKSRPRAASIFSSIKQLLQLRKQITLISRSRKALIGAAVVGFWIVIAFVGPFIAPYSPFEQHVDAMNEGPSAAHWLGTDDTGRDLLSRIMCGARYTLGLAPVAVLAALVIGSTLGLVAGYSGGRTDEFIMRILDALMAMPSILIYLIVIAALGASAVNVIIAITIGGVPGIARLVRSLTLDLRTREYVAAAELRGEHALYIMFVEILPNARGPLMIDVMLRIGYAVFAIGTLGYLGLGVPPPTPDWGSMVQRAHKFIFTNPWAVLWPSLAISSFVVGLNLLADGLRQGSMQYQ